MRDVNSKPTLDEIAQARPSRPEGPRNEHKDDPQRLLARLREVGTTGITTGELIREGCCGLRPPNRIMDLRKAGHLIRTIPEGHGVFRYVLICESERPITQRPAKKKVTQNRFSDSPDWYERQTGRKRPGWQPRPFSEKRMADPDCFVLTPPEPRQ